MAQSPVFNRPVPQVCFMGPSMAAPPLYPFNSSISIHTKALWGLLAGRMHSYPDNPSALFRITDVLHFSPFIQTEAFP
ncbi:MAG: hypothetical protein LUE98_05390 [Tannerellaceae bacterium]|nr:hypothetical protein [Tannerellaceae bacterium]